MTTSNAISDDKFGITAVFSDGIYLGLRAYGTLKPDSRLVPCQWETSLQSNTVSHWLGANLESAPTLYIQSQSSFSVLTRRGDIAWYILSLFNGLALYSHNNGHVDKTFSLLHAKYSITKHNYMAFKGRNVLNVTFSGVCWVLILDWRDLNSE